MIERLENLIERIEDENSWDFGFASSLRDQTKEGRSLSPRQTEILEKIEGHSKARIKVTESERRHPVLHSPVLAWKIFRARALR